MIILYDIDRVKILLLISINITQIFDFDPLIAYNVEDA